jgi:hypothetical protein
MSAQGARSGSRSARWEVGMFLRITHAQVDPAQYDQVMSLAQETVDAVKRLPGVQHVYQAGDASSGWAVIISLWDTREHAAFDRSVLAEIVSRVESMGAKIEPPQIYKVTAHG